MSASGASGPLVYGSNLASFVDSHPGNVSVKLDENWPCGIGGDII